MQITKEMIEAAYVLLCKTPPFNRWKLPPASEVKFSVIKTQDIRADYCYSGRHEIRVSDKTHSYLSALLASIGHEMCHMRQQLTAPSDRAEHGRIFNRFADQACKHHGWDRKAF